MSIEFKQVFPYEEDKINEVYEIIKSSGEFMFEQHGLVHWKSPYPKEAIKKNCENRKVFLAKNIKNNKYVHTFQLELIEEYTTIREYRIQEANQKIAVINKFATVPQAAGRGIGTLSMNFIEELCLNRGIYCISLDVYDKSEHAIQFYIKKGFSVTGTKMTKNFRVYQMEKQLKVD